MGDNVSLGERITELRKENNLSQGQLAEAIGVSRQAVSKWENDLSSPDTLNLIRLSDVLNTEVEYLATGKKPVYETPIVVNMIRKPDEVKIVEKVVEKPVIRRITRIKYRRNVNELIIIGTLCFIAGLVIGLIM